jgi:hypothetical protein
MSTTTDNRVMNVSGLLVALVVSGALMFITYVMMSREIPEKNHDLVVFVSGFITAAVGTIINFYFGSSSATRKQGDAASALAQTVASLTPNQQPTNTTTVTVTPPPGQTADVTNQPEQQP